MSFIHNLYVKYNSLFEAKSFTYRYVPAPPIYRDPSWYDGGLYKVSGYISIDPGLPPPSMCVVRLYCRLTSRFITDTKPDAITGYYEFDYLRVGPWMVIVVDKTETYNAVVADRILAVPR